MLKSSPLLFVLRIAAAVLIGLVLATSSALRPVLAEPTYPTLEGRRVVDTANLIPDAARPALERKLADLEAKTSAQLVIVTVPDLQGYAVEEFSIGLLRSWKIGQKNVNNGAIILVSKAERKIRIEVGYGLEGALTDAASKIIITNAMVPPLRTGDYGAAFTRAVDDISSIITGEARDQGWKGASRTDGQKPGIDWTGLMLIVLFVVIMIWLQSNQRGARLRGGSPGVIVFPGSGWGGGGGNSGGGFSGGGGDGGGGGASGDF